MFASVILFVLPLLSAFSIHPRDKEDVSRRLALAGLSVAYNMSLGPFQGPQITAFYADIGFFTVGFEFDDAVDIEVRSKSGFEVIPFRDSEND